MNNSFDYIIVGAGSAGCVLARRLIDTGNVTVALIEAGRRDSNPLVHMPFGVALLSRMTSINWNYNTQPQTQLNDRALFWPRGKVMGGSSSVNAMCYIRGQDSDYDDWVSQGALGWSAEEVLPYFIKSEDNSRGSCSRHGVDGPLGVSDLRHTEALSRAFIQAHSECDLPVVADFNAQYHYGLGLYQATHRNGQRCSTAAGFIAPVSEHANLTLFTECMVHKIIIADGIATGVDCMLDDALTRLTAKHEVILSGGAINSPQLLMLSGIGPQSHLAEHGIECIKDAGGVGQNLQDHLDVIIQVKTSVREGYAIMPALVPKYTQHMAKYLINRHGLFASNVAEAGGFAASRFATPQRPDLQFHFIPALLVDHGRGQEFAYGYGVHVCHLYPQSRGSITLSSNNALDAPMIDPNYLAHEDDLMALVDGVNLALRLLHSSAFSQYQPIPWQPAAAQLSEAEVIAFIKATAQTVYHPVGTCKMGSADDPLSVVNPHCQVHDIAGLRVVDASVMPSIIGGNTNAPTIMIAEKIADHIIHSFTA